MGLITSLDTLGEGPNFNSVVTPVISAAAYSNGLAVGPIQQLLPNPLSDISAGLIQSCQIFDADGQDAALDVVFFSGAPSGGSIITDHTQIAIAAADLPLIVGVASIVSWKLLGATKPGQGQAVNLALPFLLGAGASLYAAIVCRGTPTWASTSSIILSVTGLRA